LYLSAFPEDSFIPKESLVWMWIAEGFVVDEKKGIRLFEIGEGYFNDLINRSLIQAVADDYDDSIILGCRVHDMVLDWIRLISSEEIFFTVVDKDDTLDQNNVY
jgi:disease resistance protein RPM1